MAKANPESNDKNLGYSSATEAPGNIDVGEDMVEGLSLDAYNRAEVYTVLGEGSGSSELYILDPTVSHTEEAVEHFAGLFSEADLLVPESNYYDVVWFIPREDFRVDEDLETKTGYVEGEKGKYYLVSNSQSK